MRVSLGLVLAASVAVVVVACSSSESPAPAGNVVDSGSGEVDGANPRDGAGPLDGAADTSTTDASADGSSDAAALAFALISSAYAEGASIPAKYTCNGANVSPPLAWTAGPGGTMSYAIVFTDLTNALIHSVIYDIPANVLALPEAIPNMYAPAAPAGAHQTIPGFGGGFGYRGPCPPIEHVYEMDLHAVDVAVLPGAGTNTTTTTGKALILAHSLGSTKLTGKYKQP